MASGPWRPSPILCGAVACGALVLLLWPLLALPSQVRGTGVTCCSADAVFRPCMGPSVSTSLVPVSRASSQELPMHLPPLTEMRRACTGHVPLSHGKACWTTDLHKSLGEPRWEGGSLNRAACEAGSPLPPQGHGTPGRTPPEGSAMPCFPSAHPPSSASFPCSRYASLQLPAQLNFFPKIRLGPQKYLEVCPDPKPMKSVPESS